MDIGVHEAVTKPPSRATMTDWTISSMNQIPEGMIKNAWLQGEYSYFPNEARATYETEDDYDEDDADDIIEVEESV